MSQALLVIKKEDRAAADLAKDVIDAIGGKIEELTKAVASQMEVISVNQNDNQSASNTIVLFTAFVPLIFDMLSDSLKSVTPNMKKKKDEVFTTLKSQIIKPFKEMASSLNVAFTAIAASWNDRIQAPLVPSSEAALTFVKTMTDHEPMLSQLEGTRIQ